MALSSQRFISTLTKDTYALVLAGSKGNCLHELTQWRAKPATYFGGKFRLIDFPISNCVNSGIRNVGVATQYKSHSLIKHINRAWGHFKKELGESIEVLPASQQMGENWYIGTADAVYQNIDIIRHELPKYILILSADHVYKMDYGPLIAAHVQSGADMTVSCIEVPVGDAIENFGIVEVDENKKVLQFIEKPTSPKELPNKPGVALASMGNYVFNTDFLFEQLELDHKNKLSGGDFGNDIFPELVKKYDIRAYQFIYELDHTITPYWRDVGSLDAFWEAHMDLISVDPQLDLYDGDWPIWTYHKLSAPAKFVNSYQYDQGNAVNSMISNGVIIYGSMVNNSVIFANTQVCSRTKVNNSVIFPDVIIGKNCSINKCIIDSGVTIPDDMNIGVNYEEDIKNGFRVTNKGVVLVTCSMMEKSKISIDMNGSDIPMHQTTRSKITSKSICCQTY